MRLSMLPLVFVEFVFFNTMGRIIPLGREDEMGKLWRAGKDIIWIRRLIENNETINTCSDS